MTDKEKKWNYTLTAETKLIIHGHFSWWIVLVCWCANKKPKQLTAMVIQK